MKKIVLSTLVASSLMFGANIEPFVGIDLSKADADIKDTYSIYSGTVDVGSTTLNAGDSFSTSYSAKDSSPALKLGAIINDNHRVYLRYAKYEDQGGEVKMTTANYDYLFTNIDSKYKIVPFIGAHLGQGKLSSDLLGSGTGTVYGLQTGAIIPIKSGFELEISLAYTKSNVDMKNSTPTINGTFDGVTFNNAVLAGESEFEDATSINFGINYRF